MVSIWNVKELEMKVKNPEKKLRDQKNPFVLAKI